MQLTLCKNREGSEVAAPSANVAEPIHATPLRSKEKPSATGSVTKRADSTCAAPCSNSKNPSCARPRTGRDKSSQLMPCSDKDSSKVDTPSTDREESGHAPPGTEIDKLDCTKLRANKKKPSCKGSSTDKAEPTLL